MIKVFTESTFFNGLFQILIGGRYQTNIYRYLLCRTYRTYFSLLQGTKQLYLHFITKVSDLIQKDSTTVGCNESPRFICQSTCKRTFHMTEKFGSSQFFGDRSTIYGNKRFIVSFAKLMNTVRHILFSCSAGTVDKYGHIGRSYQTYIIVELFGCITFSFQISTMIFC